jgi:hypothetical protein
VELQSLGKLFKRQAIGVSIYNEPNRIDENQDLMFLD